MGGLDDWRDQTAQVRDSRTLGLTEPAATAAGNAATALEGQVSTAKGELGRVAHIGEVGTFTSATAEKQYLTQDWSDVSALFEDMTGFLGAYKAAVTEAGKNLINET